MRNFLFVFCATLFAFCMTMLAGCGSASHFKVKSGVIREDPATLKVTQKQVLGTGFFVNQTGLALTAAHIFRGRIPNTEQAQLWWGGRDSGTPATLVAVDWVMDLALIQVATRTSIPVRPLCVSVTQGDSVIAFGAPEHKVLRSRGTLSGVYAEPTPCEVQEEDTGVGVRCALEKRSIVTPGVQLDQPSRGAQAEIIEVTSVVRPGFSGGSLRYKRAQEQACTAGVLIQYDRINKRTRAVYPLNSSTITRYLLAHAPEFLENYR